MWAKVLSGLKWLLVSILPSILAEAKKPKEVTFTGNDKELKVDMDAALENQVSKERTDEEV